MIFFISYGMIVVNGIPDGMKKLTGGQIRAGRALLRITAEELARRAHLGVTTVRRAELEDGPVSMTMANAAAVLRAFDEAGVELLWPEEGRHGYGVWFKDGVEAAKTGATQGAATSQGDDKGGLDALGWDDWPEVGELIEDDEPLPPLDWTDEDRAEQIEHWRSRPEKWAALHEVSRQCLLRAMGVERL
jgi:hypothetical protein